MSQIFGPVWFLLAQSPGEGGQRHAFSGPQAYNHYAVVDRLGLGAPLWPVHTCQARCARGRPSGDAGLPGWRSVCVAGSPAINRTQGLVLGFVVVAVVALVVMLALSADVRGQPR